MSRRGLSKLCELDDFQRPEIRDTIRSVFRAHAERHPDFPGGREYRKHWEVAMALLALDRGGVLHPSAEILGVGAGNEPTLYELTNRARRVFATDLYANEGWEESASVGMLLDPGQYWSGRWNPRRLVVQHMDGRDLQYEAESFDGVFSSSSLEHFGDETDVRRALEEMHRVLRPGGVLSLSTEFRLAGPPPGLPAILMFDRQQLERLLFDGLAWRPLESDGLDTTVPDVEPVLFAEAAADVRAHVAEHGALQFELLEWSRYPHVVLQEGEHVWTSVHVALRKP